MNSYKSFIDIKKLLSIEQYISELINLAIPIFPNFEYRYKALELTPLDEVNVVILGQDPYHTRYKAHGLSFSVPHGQKLPPSLKNIFKELEDDVGIINTTGNLEPWAKQGVLLLNSVLTVEENKPGSHYNIGWEEITNSIIKGISEKTLCTVFILWGKKAQEKEALICNYRNHLIIKSPHPSPYSANNGFFGSKPFSKTNAFLKEVGQKEIDWKL